MDIMRPSKGADGEKMFLGPLPTLWVLLVCACNSKRTLILRSMFGRREGLYMIKKIATAATVVALVAAQPAWAAGFSYSHVHGKVIVDGAKAHKQGPLQVGDVVVTGARSTVRITFPDNCTITVDPNSTVTVGSESPCKVAAAPAPTTPVAPVVAEAAGLSPTVIVGGFVIVAAVGVGIAVSQNSSPK